VVRSLHVECSLNWNCKNTHQVKKSSKTTFALLPADENLTTWQRWVISVITGGGSIDNAWQTRGGSRISTLTSTDRGPEEVNHQLHRLGNSLNFQVGPILISFKFWQLWGHMTCRLWANHF